MSVAILIVHQELQADRYPKASSGFAVSFASARHPPRRETARFTPKESITIRPHPRARPLYSGLVTDTPSAELDDLIADATIDAYDTSEQLMGFFNMIEEHLAVPFKTTILGLTVTVEGVTYDENRFVAECVRGEHRQTIDLRDLPTPSPPPTGSQWIAAYCRWARRQ
jgi:hypothetical protein